MIADCETCDRKQIPCKSCQESQRATCYRCDGDVDDPYGEQPERDEVKPLGQIIPPNSTALDEFTRLFLECTECGPAFDRACSHCGGLAYRPGGY